MELFGRIRITYIECFQRPKQRYLRLNLDYIIVECFDDNQILRLKPAGMTSSSCGHFRARADWWFTGHGL